MRRQRASVMDWPIKVHCDGTSLAVSPLQFFLSYTVPRLSTRIMHTMCKGEIGVQTNYFAE